MKSDLFCCQSPSLPPILFNVDIVSPFDVCIFIYISGMFCYVILLLWVLAQLECITMLLDFQGIYNDESQACLDWLERMEAAAKRCKPSTRLLLDFRSLSSPARDELRSRIMSWQESREQISDDNE